MKLRATLQQCTGVGLLLAGMAVSLPLAAGAAELAVQEQGAQDRGQGPLAIIDISPRLYLRALELKASGNCEQAIPMFYRLAQRGEGFELAQFHLGECMMRAAEQTPSDTGFLTGLVWVRRAAEAGNPQAQATLALFYLGGPEALRDREEAALWFALFERNPARKRPAFSSPLSDSDREQIEAALGAELRAQAAERARNWTRSVWAPPGEGMPGIGENIRR